MKNEDDYLPEGDLVPIRWTDSIIKTLRFVVESHAFIEEDAEELHNSKFRNIENMTTSGAPDQVRLGRLVGLGALGTQTTHSTRTRPLYFY